jgi:hypothetical protein
MKPGPIPPGDVARMAGRRRHALPLRLLPALAGGRLTALQGDTGTPLSWEKIDRFHAAWDGSGLVLRQG